MDRLDDLELENSRVIASFCEREPKSYGTYYQQWAKQLNAKEVSIHDISDAITLFHTIDATHTDMTRLGIHKANALIDHAREMRGEAPLHQAHGGRRHSGRPFSR